MGVRVSLSLLRLKQLTEFNKIRYEGRRAEGMGGTRENI
jgi:hypothetical protein